MERNNRKILQGQVISNKNQKTITVLVETYKNHSLYKKRVKYSKKYLVHDEYGSAHVGDNVSIMETRPLSKTKHFRLIEVTKKAIS